jgi:hypothetical protein
MEAKMSQSNFSIFRSVKPEPDTTIELRMPKTTMRAPTYVPYVVDNLWEWKRPKSYSCRRFSVYASPQEYLATESGPEGGTVYKVEFKGKFKLCQVKGWSDSRKHPDCRSLKKVLTKRLGQDWIDSKISEKEELGRLWIPCLTKDEMNYLFGSNEKLRDIKDEIYNAITYWNDVALIKNGNGLADPEGELFFEAEDGYYLRS